MNVTAIIAEYNPFHNGHLYQMEEAKKRTKADAVLVLLSGDFTERGEIAVYDKWTRARTALLAGADVVLELPAVCATGSAEYFAEGAIRILGSLHCVDSLSFGVETDCFPEGATEEDCLSLLMILAEILAEEPDLYRRTLIDLCRKGTGFATARTHALQAVLQEEPESAETSFLLPHLSAILSSPNTILALEYLKALIRQKSPIRPVLLFRKGADYHDKDLNSPCPSASAIRYALKRGVRPAELSACMPGFAIPCLKDLVPLFPDDASVLLNEKIRTLSEDADIFDLGKDLADRIRNHRNTYRTWSDWCGTLKTKEITYTHISRALTHLLLDITAEDARTVRSLTNGGYARILGLKKDSPLLSVLKANAEIPLVTKLSDFERKLRKDLTAEPGNDTNAKIKKQLETDRHASDLYRLLYWQKTDISLPDDYHTGIEVIKAEII